MKSIFRIQYMMLAALLAVGIQFSFVSCSDDPGAENYYTSTKEYAADVLRNNENFSEFRKIVERSHMMELLGTYGNITLFAPTNEAVQKYLAGRGMTSVDELSLDDCDTITYTHIIDKMAYYTTDFNDGTYQTANLLDRHLTITCDSDTVSVPGEVNIKFFIEKTAEMIVVDDSVANGVVHVMNQVIGTNSSMLPDVIGMDENVSLFYQALVDTHMADSLYKFIDENYSVGTDSVGWDSDRPCVHTAVEYDAVGYMEHRYYKFTAFCPTNKVFEEKYGVTDIEGLKTLAASIYDPVYPEDADVTDLTSRRNSLNRFVSYHLLDRMGTYYGLTCVDGPDPDGLVRMFNRRKMDISDWYETMLPHSVLKCSYPTSVTDLDAVGLYINRRGIMSNPDRRGVKIRGAKVAKASEMPYAQEAANGIYHYIDDILKYDNETQFTVLNERMRIDATTLSPDFMTSGARGHVTATTIKNGKYANSSQGKTVRTNPNHCLGFKAGSAKNFYYTDATHLHVRPRYLGFWSYEGDEIIVKGVFDLAMKLPPVPSGEWEVRMFTCVGFPSRGIVQYYLGQKKPGVTDVKSASDIAWVPQGIPFDMRPKGTSAKIGYKTDSSLGDAEQIQAFDKQFHNRGWMKGWASSGTINPEGTNNMNGDGFRDQTDNLRRVIGTFQSDGKTDWYLRFQQKMESADNELNFDALEICPRSVYADPDIPEDKY